MILVTGGTGHTGSALLEGLSGQAIRTRALVRDPGRAKIDLPHVEVVAGDLTDAASLRRALAGVERAFLLSPPVEENWRLETAFIDAAREAGLRHVVKLSAAGASAEAPHRFGRWHHRAEQHLRDSGLPWTILRANFFMQNLLDLAGLIKSGTIALPAGTGEAPMVDTRDIAAVAEACLTEDGHEGNTYDVTGSESLSYAQVADRFTNALGRPVKYVDVPPEAARQSMTDAGLPAWLADALNELYAELRAGHLNRRSDCVETVAHKQPITLDEFIGDYRKVFE